MSYITFYHVYVHNKWPQQALFLPGCRHKLSPQSSCRLCNRHLHHLQRQPSSYLQSLQVQVFQFLFHYSSVIYVSFLVLLLFLKSAHALIQKVPYLFFQFLFVNLHSFQPSYSIHLQDLSAS